MATPKHLSIIVVGASGDLARRKIFPALFALYCQGYLPEGIRIFGFARSQMDQAAFRAHIMERLTCRYVPGESCAEKMESFLDRCHYQAGQYADPDAFLNLYELMRQHETSAATNRLFYLAIPPSIFLEVARAIGDAGLVACGSNDPWSRVVIEKPFGRDRASSDQLTTELAKVFSEGHTYRIDHYLGKEVIQNLMVLRFANLVFAPIWNRKYIQSVTIDWREDLGLEGRAGYFDDYGIIRDVAQNHLLQILALVAMERPRDMTASAIRDAKVDVLRAIAPLTQTRVLVGQYGPGTVNGVEHIGYLEEDGIDGSTTPTFVRAELHIDNPRWEGVPFLIQAGKALDSRSNEVHIRFRDVESNIFCDGGTGCLPTNDLRIRIQPNEAITLRVVSKEPGLDMSLVETQLNLQYEAAFDKEIPDAYEALLLDVLEGQKGLFIRSDELEAAWDIFTPLLHELELHSATPVSYPFGSSGPVKVE